jgi:hypothetical protein
LRVACAIGSSLPVSIRQHTSAYVSIRQQRQHFARGMRHRKQLACQHTSAYVSIRQHTSAAPAFCAWHAP